MIIELRIYQIINGRMQAILDRFRDDTIRIFNKHDMKIVDFWVDENDSKNRLYYLVEHKDMESRERNFQAFQEDPEWLKLKERTEQDGPLYEKIEEVFMKQAPFFYTSNVTRKA
ncbi:MAG: NIPSNAP family protein [Bacillota bacterium]